MGSQRVSTKNRRTRPMDLPPDRSPLRSGGSGALVGGTLTPAVETTPTPPATVPTPPDVPILDAPTGLTLASTVLVMSGVVGKWFATVTWDVVSNAASYHVEWTPYGSFSNAIPIDTTQPNATFEVYMNTSYQVRVRAVGADGGVSDWSNTLAFTSAIDPTAPGVPTGVSATFADTGDLVISWTKGSGANLKDTLVDIFPDNTYTDPYLIRHEVAGNSTVITLKENLTHGALATVYVRLMSRSYAGVLSAPVTTSAAYALPAAPTVTPRWDLRSGAMTLDWTPAARAVSYGITIGTTYEGTVLANRYVYPLDLNKSEHSGTASLSLQYTVQGIDVFGRYGTATTAVTNAPLPPTPSSILVDFSSPNCVVSWSVSEPVAAFSLDMDLATYETQSQQFVYTFERNAADHGGTASPMLTCSIRSKDVFNRKGTIVSFTATNPVPTAPSAVSATGYFSGIAIQTTVTIPPDLKTLKYRVIKDGSTLTTISSNATQFTYTAPSSGTYQIAVLVEDVFSQQSSETLSSSVVLDMITITELRAETIYTDDAGHSSSSLNVLKDDNRTSSGVSYT